MTTGALLSEKRALNPGDDIPTWVWSALNLGHIIPTWVWSALNPGHYIPTWVWSIPDSGQGFQTLRRFLPVLILCDIIAETCLVDAGQVTVTEDPCLRKAGLQFPDQFCHAPFLGLGARVGELSLCIQTSSPLR